MCDSRGWMYERKTNDGRLSDNFVEGVEKFLDDAYSSANISKSGDKIKCPCYQCSNRKFLTRQDVKLHLWRRGFIPGYYRWTAHGESYTVIEKSVRKHVETQPTGGLENYRVMIEDAMGPPQSRQASAPEDVDELGEEPNEAAWNFFNLLQDADESLWEGCEKQTKLSTISQLLNLKSETNMSVSCFDRMLSILKSCMPDSEKLLANFYEKKKILKKLGLGYIKIDACPNNCVIYYGANNSDTTCAICGHERFKPSHNKRRKVSYKVLRYLPITPRLQRLYMSRFTAEHMTWHAKLGDPEQIVHPGDSEAWKHFDMVYKNFAC